MEKRPHWRPRITIGAKLLGLLSALLVCTVSTALWVSSRLFIQDNTALIQQLNSDSAQHIAVHLRSSLVAAAEKIRVLGAIVSKDYLGEEVRKPVIKEFFAKDKDFLGVVVFEIAPDGKHSWKNAAIAPDLAAMGDEKGEKAVELAGDFSVTELAGGEIKVSPTHLIDGTNAILIGFPFLKLQTPEGTRVEVLVGMVRESGLVKELKESRLVTLMVVDGKGSLVTHTDPRFAQKRDAFRQSLPVRKLLEGRANNGQVRYKDPGGEGAMLGAFQTVGFGNLGVIAEVPEEKAFEAAKRAEYRTMLLAALMLAIAIVAGMLYSDTITWPIRVLVNVSKKIARGDFDVNLKPKSRDEIAHLAQAFNDMAKGLAERKKYESAFNKYHSKEMAEMVLNGEVKLGGEKREAVIFFSDIRDFTAISEKLSPEGVVDMINEYMTRMVAVIQRHGGRIDKYVGDAIMATWGVPKSTPEDVRSAVAASLEIRKELNALNEVRIARGDGAIKMGIGLNLGEVIAGNIGSNERLEYTVIGDSVNLASRVESMTKEYGTDLLISGAVADRIIGQFIIEECGSVKVKGKSEPVHIFKVNGIIDDFGQPVVIATPYSSYEKSASDKRAA